jgi:N-acetylmuramoyl-L-alanine amidase CwlA
MTAVDLTIPNLGLSAIQKQQWDELKRRIEKKSQRRNDVAHGCVYFWPKHQLEEKRVFIAPSVFDKNRPFSLSTLDQGTYITGKNLDEIRKSFADVAERTLDFVREILPRSKKTRRKTV